MAVDFRVTQRTFTGYVRDPEHNPAPNDVKLERMAMYRQLVYNNIESFLAGNFPVIRKIFTDENWHGMVQDFIVMHRAETPYFAEISEEFLAYLENERQNPDDFPFLLELAHYEWVELALSVATENIEASIQVPDNLLDCNIALSPLAWLLIYRFPVQQIAPDFLPIAPPDLPTTLVAYRDSADEVKFMEINPITYRLLEIVQEQGTVSVLACLMQVAEESQHPNPDALMVGGLQTLKELAEKAIVYVR